jgi:hypothetical protein
MLAASIFERNSHENYLAQEKEKEWNNPQLSKVGG